MKKQFAVLLSAGILIFSIGMSMSPVSEPLIACAEYESEENELLSLINDLRSQNGLPAFQTTPLMQQAADARVQEALELFSSRRPNGEVGSTIMNEYGIVYDEGACCIAGNSVSMEKMYNYLVGVPAEKSKMVNAVYNFIGIGITKAANGKYYGALLFADKTGEGTEPVQTETTPEETTTTTEETTTTTTTTEETTTTTTTTTTEETTTTTTTTTEETTTTTTTTTTEETTTTTTTTTTPETTTTTTTTTPETTTTTEETTTEPVQTKKWGDVENDGIVNSMDAAKVLVYAAHYGAGTLYELSWDEQERVRNFADVNQDGNVNAKDAAVILEYAAEFGSGAFRGNLDEYVREKFNIYL